MYGHSHDRAVKKAIKRINRMKRNAHKRDSEPRSYIVPTKAPTRVMTVYKPKKPKSRMKPKVSGSVRSIR